MEFSRQESWRGWPFPFPGGLPDPRVKLVTPALQADSLPSEPSGKPMYICASVSVYICILVSPQNLEKEAVITRNWYGLHVQTSLG